MDDKKNVLATLSGDELQRFRGYLKQRDEAAQRVGMAALEYQKIIATMEAQIAESLQCETRLATDIAQRNDIPANTNFEIDYDKGRLVEVK